jgi:acyl carrier protein
MNFKKEFESVQKTDELSPSRRQLVKEVTSLIIDAVGLHHVDPTQLTDETSLRNGGLELDSVDILEVVVMIEQQFNVKVADAETGKKYFKTIGSIADFIQSQSVKKEG